LPATTTTALVGVITTKTNIKSQDRIAGWQDFVLMFNGKIALRLRERPEQDCRMARFCAIQ
jgi:hypothetical protein